MILLLLAKFAKIKLRLNTWPKVHSNNIACIQDVEFYNSLKYILDNDPEPLCLRFTATRDHYGEVTW